MPRLSSQSRHHLANQILDFVRDGRYGIGHHLTEQRLSSQLEVSRTPIRASLKLLAKHGIVEARKNQGFFLKKPFDVLQHVRLAVPSSTEQKLYERLVRDRLAGKLPDSVTQSEIAGRYGVDRTVLIRVLAQLAEDNLIARNKGHGWRFLPTLDTEIALRSSYELRLTVEPAALLLKSFRADPAVIERCRVQHLSLLGRPNINSVDRSHLFETDVAFHETLAQSSGNAFFLQAVQQQNRLRRFLEFWTYSNKRRVHDWCREHLAILDAIKAGDLGRAANAMRKHLTNAYSAVPTITPKRQDKLRRTGVQRTSAFDQEG